MTMQASEPMMVCTATYTLSKTPLSKVVITGSTVKMCKAYPMFSYRYWESYEDRNLSIVHIEVSHSAGVFYDIDICSGLRSKFENT